MPSGGDTPLVRNRQWVLDKYFDGKDPTSQFVWSRDLLCPDLDTDTAGLMHSISGGCCVYAARYALARQLRLPIGTPITSHGEDVNVTVACQVFELWLALRTVSGGPEEHRASLPKILNCFKSSLCNEGLMPHIECHGEMKDTRKRKRHGTRGYNCFECLGVGSCTVRRDV